MTDCLNADHDPNDVLAAADMQETLVNFIEASFRSTIELNATTSGVELVGDLFRTMKGNILLSHVAGAYCHRPGYAQAVACLAACR